MRLRSPAYRTAAAAFIALQLLGAALWPVVDASLEAAERDTAAHVESQQATPCAPSHDDFFCQVCRTISLTGRAAAGVVTLFAAPVLTVAEVTQPHIVSRHTLYSAHRPRAPPLS